MSAPVLTGEIVGFRQWRVTPDLVLRAAAHRDRDTWTVGDNTAVCRRMNWDVPAFREKYQLAAMAPDMKPAPCGDLPGENCECGFYGLHSPNDFWYGDQARQAQGFFLTTNFDDSDPLVSGVIVGWGKLQVHHQGFRSEFARVAALAVPKSKRDAAVARAVAEAYGVPCVAVNSLAKIADEFGSTIPEELRPAAPAPKPDDLAWVFKSMQLVSPRSSPRSSLVGPSFHAPIAPRPASPSVSSLDKALERLVEKHLGMRNLGIQSAKPGDGKVSEAVRRAPSNRQGPPRPKRAPKRLGP